MECEDGTVTPFGIFLIVWLATILAAFFVQGGWGAKLAKQDFVSPILVAFLWPLGLVAMVGAAPFFLVWLAGWWTARR